MSLNKSIVEDAALEWSCLRAGTHRQIGELGYSCLGAEALTPTLSQKERAKGEAIRRLNPAIPEEASACASHADRRATVADSATARTEWRRKP